MSNADPYAWMDTAIDKTFADVLPQQANAIRQNVASAANTNPDAEARNQQLAAATRMPLDTVRNMGDTIRAQAAGQQVDALTIVRNYPATATLLQDPDKTKLVHDDIPATTNVEQAARMVSHTPPTDTGASWWQRLGSGKFWGDTAKYVFSANSNSDDNLTSDLWHSAQTVSGDIGSTFMRAVGAVGLAADKINAITGSPTNLADSAFKWARFYADQADAKAPQDLHNQLTRQVATLGLQLPMMLATGGESEAPQAAESVTQFVTGAFRHAAKAMAIPSLTDASETSRHVYEQTGDSVAAARAGLAQYLTSTASGVVPLSAPGGIATRMATGAGVGIVQGELSRQVMNWVLPESMQQQFDPEQLLLSGVTGAMLGGFGPHAESAAGVDALHRARQQAALAARASYDDTALRNLVQSSVDSKLRERNPQAFHDLVEQATQDGPVSDVWIDARTLDSTLAQSGVTRPDLERTMPAVADQLDTALATGGDVRIPVADFATHIAGSGLEEKLLPDVRTAPDAMTPREAEAYRANNESLMREHAQNMVDLQGRADQLQADGESVRKAIKDQLDATKRYQPAVSDAYSTLMANFYLTQAGRLGITPSEMFERYPVRIGAQNPAGEALAQDSDAFRNWFGDSKVVDENGKPLVVYHGSPDARFMGEDAVFKSQKERIGLGRAEGAHWFTPSQAAAKTYANPHRAFDYQNAEEGVIAAYLKLENPLVIDGGGKTWRDAQKHGKTSDVIAQARAAGHDGVVIHNVKDDYNNSKNTKPTDTYVVFDSKQIKSATDNRGTFDPNNPSILEQRQRGFFDPATKTIGLLKDADLSTFIHESGHFFLDTMGHLAAQDDAPLSVKADMATVLDWMGIKDTSEQSALDRWHSMSLDEQRQAHEQFARGFEAYVMEGKAPSLEMRGVFQRFRAWLLNVYKSLSALNVKLTDDVRGVMDRMLASNDAIREAEQARAFEPMFKTPEEAAKFGIDADAYHRLGEQATQAAIEQLQTKGVKDMAWLGRARDKALKRLNKQAAEVRKGVEREVKTEVYQQPVYRAWQWLTGKLPKEGEEVTAGRLNLTDLEHRMMVPPETVDRLRELGMVAKKSGEGLHPDIVAEMFGFGSGREMIDALATVQHPKLVIDGLTDQRMLEQHGELASPEALSRAADEAVHNEARARFIATELAALEQATSVRAATGRKTKNGHAISVDALARAAKQVAEDTIARMKIRDVNPTRFTAAEARSAKQAGEALGKGDTQAAAQAKRAQMLNNRLAKTAMDAVDEIAAGVKYLRKFDKASVREAVGAEYTAQIDALLERFDLRQSTPLNAAGRRQSLLEWLQAQRDKGLEPAVPDYLLDEAQRLPYREMSVEDFRGLLDSVKSIEHLGRLKNKLLDLKEQRDIDTVVGEALETLKTLPQRDEAEPRNPGEGGKGLDKINAKYLKGASLLRSADASLLKMEQLFDWLDAHNPHGVFNRVVFKRIAEAQGVENDLLHEVTGKLKALHEALPKNAQRDLLERYTVPELRDSRTGKPSSLLKKEILAIALNTGNESNFSKMLQGEGWSEPAVWAVLNKHMTKGDWDFVQGVWDTLDGLWPHIAVMEKRLSGVEPPRVEARPVTTPHGQYRGGYYPVIYDPLRAHDVDMRNERSGASLFENTFSRPGTAHGHTNARVDYARPLYLSLDVLPRHISQVVHDLAYREAIIDAYKVLSDSRIRQGIEGTLGREYYKQIRPWLQAIANDKVYDARGLAFWDKAAHSARTATTLVGLGFRATTMMIHGATAGSNSVGEIGARWFASGVKAFAGSPERMRAARDFVFERSAEMRNRMNETDRDIRDAMREMDLRGATGVTGAATRALDPVKRYAYYGISMLDMASAMPTWLGAYNRALHEGRAEDQAIYEADKAVRNAHGGGGVKDLAAVQRGPEFMKLFTMFYSFWNHFYNRQRDIGRTAVGIPGQIREGNYQGARRDFAMVLARSWFYFIIPQLLHAALKPPAPGSQDEDEHWLAWAAKEIGLGMFSGIPIARDIASSTATGRDYSPTPAAQVVTSFGQVAKDAQHALTDEPVSDKWLKHAVQTSGYVFGLPLGQLATTAQFLWDVHEGTQAPSDLADWWRGLVYGSTQHH